MPSRSIKAHFDTQNQPVPQTKQADPAQKANNAGGFSFVVSDKDRLLRFLMLGSDGGTYYVNEKKLTEQNIDFLVELIKRDPEMVLNTTLEVSHSGRAFRNSSAIFVLALLFKHANAEYKSHGFLHNSLPKIARTSTHLFEFASYVELLGAGAFDANLTSSPAYAASMKRLAEGKPVGPKGSGGGWGKSKRKAVAAWYESKTPDQLAYQSVKYRQRDGWTHRDLFRLSHPKNVDQEVGNFILGKELGEIQSKIIYGYEAMCESTSVTEAVGTLTEFPHLPWETVPTQFHKEPALWAKLFENGQLKGQALLRQITRLARLGMFKDMVFAREYADRLIDEKMIAESRLHPIQYLLALIGHVEGQIVRSKTADRFDAYRSGGRQRDWDVSPIIRDALDAGFYAAFKAVEPANKRTFIALDVSGSMSSMAMGIDLSCAQVGAAMAMTIARTEPYYDIKGFTAGSSPTRAGYAYRSRANMLTDLGISATTSLPDAMRKVQQDNFGSTDCSLPFEYALQNDISIDTFVVITDNETYAGKQHPHVALQKYRRHSGIDAKLIVMGMTATEITIADPSDRGMLDISGADTSIPRLVAEFSAGRI